MTITTTKPVELTTPTTGTPAAPSRRTRRTWIAVGGAAVLIAAAAGIGVAAYERSQTPEPTTPAVSGSSFTSDAAESAHGSGTAVRTGTGATVGATGTAANAVTDDASSIAHGSGSHVVTGTGQDVH